MTTQEQWIESSFSSRYLVSNFGRVYDQQDEMIVQTHIGADGQHRVRLWKNNVGEMFVLCCLIADSFFEQNLADKEITHKNLDKNDNAVWNLEVTMFNSKLDIFEPNTTRSSRKCSRVRIVETGEEFESTGQVDRFLGVSNGSVSKTLRGLQPTCRGYTFELI